MSKHTPGPWDFSWQIQPNGCPTVGHKGLMVCMVAHSAKQEDQRETALANAALISAAPDMIEALEKAVLRIQANLGDERDMGPESMAYLLETFQAAIAKANGSGD